MPVEVKWSIRMTSCAGICTFHPRNRQCVITLSEPLLKLRPRKDLVETLLHEMIHGYLFLTNNNRDRNGHGPEFCKHMNRINTAAGTKITIYHSFHDEVKLYKQHWWRCNGPCQKRPPYFGTVRRAMNRAPGPNDFWWKEHQQTCGGQFIKIKEPENFKAKTSKNKEKAKPASKSNNSTNNMFNWLMKPTSTTTPTSTPTLKNIKPLSNTSDSLSRFKKLGNNTNNVHGWGTGGPNGSNNLQKSTNLVSNTPKFSFSGTLGGSSTGQSNLLHKFDIVKKHSVSNINAKVSVKTTDTYITTKAKKSTINNNNSLNAVELVKCPICSNFVSNNNINKHLNTCLTITDNISSTESQVETDDILSMQKRKINTITLSSKKPRLDKSKILKVTNCPVCNKSFKLVDINMHLDKCLSEIDEQSNSTVKLSDKNNASETKDKCTISISSTHSNSSSSSITDDSKDFYHNSKYQISNTIETSSQKCLVCNMLIPLEMSLNDHLEDCIGSLFNDNSSLSTNYNNAEMSETALEVSFDHNNKYPCPICMQLISECFMNQHLDICLKDT
ncbi:DNA-dependent metalloprotease SPRTN isoform X2 [Ptiloglossa arizonensis]